MITRFKIFEKSNYLPVFKNEDKIKEYLSNNKDVAEGDIHQGLVELIHDEWNNNHKGASYEQILDWTAEELGQLPLFAMYLAKYNYQVCNGGHAQYFDNGYASSQSNGFGSRYHDIDKHNDFIDVFKDLEMNEILPSGKKALNIIEKFDNDLNDEIETCDNCGGRGEAPCDDCNGSGQVDCDHCSGSGEDDEGEECGNCSGDGHFECDTCAGRGHDNCQDCGGEGEISTGQQVPNYSEWSELDDQWYSVNDDLMTEFNDYLKRLELDGKKMTDIIKSAEIKWDAKKYNI